MSAPADPRLQRLLGGPGMAAVRQRLRRHYERSGAGDPAPRVRLANLEPDQHRALCQLTGRSARPARSLTLDIADLDARLHAADLAPSLRDALERLDGPIVAHAELRRELQLRWNALVDDAEVGPLLRSWLEGAPMALALLKRLGGDPERARKLLASADVVLERLPAAGMPRSQLAAQALGDAHALDRGRPAAAVVLAAWRWCERADSKLAGADREAGEDEEPAGEGRTNPDERTRDVWARAGVLVSELARPALFLNLPMPAGGGHVWTPGVPDYLSLRQLLREPPVWTVAGRRIHVCENPDIVAVAADRLCVDCAPLVCTDGMPAAAQRTLLGQLVAAGAHLHYHGDFDWPGIGIGNFVMRTWKARPWRFGAPDYRAAVEHAPQRPRDLGAARVDALWDPVLAAAMDEHGLVIAEEAVVADLLDDLGQAAGHPG